MLRIVISFITVFWFSSANAGVPAYLTPADAVASGACEETVTAFTTAGRASPSDGGGATWVYAPATTLAAITCQNGRVYELSVPVANVRIFGAMGQNEGDNSEGFRQAFAYGKAKGVPVYAPNGIYQIHSSVATIDTTGVTFYGDGQGTRLRSVDITTEVFKINVGAGQTIADLEFRDFVAEAYYSGPIAGYAAVFRVVGGAGYVGGQWRNIESRGFPVFFQVSATPRQTPFGMEGPLNWSHFSNITFSSFSREHLYGWIFETGSGTGNSYHQVGGKMNNIAWLFGGGVVGDISIEAMKQWSSANTEDSTLMLIHDNTPYRSRIKMHGGQCDAGFARLIALGSGIAYSNVDIDVMRGGNCAVGPKYAPLNNSRIGAVFGNIPAG